MRTLKALLTGAAFVGFSGAAAMAADTEGWYVGADAGANFAQDTKFDSTDKAKFDAGYGFLGQVGYDFRGPLRAEAELGWRSNGVNKVNSDKAKGSMDPTTLMFNVYYDFHNSSAFTPFLGVGIGAAYLNANKIRPKGVATGYDDGDRVFAYQGIAGVSYAIDNNWSVKGSYHYLRTTDGRFKDKLTGDKADANYKSHALFVGFTYSFGAPAKPAPAVAPAVAPQPAPAAKQTQAPMTKAYQVFFDFDRSTITPEAKRIIEQAAVSAKGPDVTHINLIGHTDSAGPDAYNMALSLRRANAVKAELVKLGIPANEISVVGKGKADPLVPTADGVREPQNRRVQINL
ncbi:MAG: OmpA family protein [Rhodospirillaceae bacterium]|nr:OmpA family protein [Rhodospirillaceae bacterium]